MDKILYGRLADTELVPFAGGLRGTLFTDWGQLKISGFLIEFREPTSYAAWVGKDVETLSWVEEGKGTIVLGEKSYELQKGDTFKTFPGQEPEITPKGTLVLYSVHMPTTRKEFPGEDMSSITIKRLKEVPSMVYEYEALGQEFFTPKYENGLGLIRFIFPINNIPLHIHPHADRIIKPISGSGFTYAHPQRFEMDEGTFCLFPKGTKHTNGPHAGEVYDLWAVQLPWVESGVTEEDSSGNEEFVTYVETVPPKPLWKTKEGLEKAVAKLRGKR